jgi:hypothetical protein
MHVLVPLLGRWQPVTGDVGTVMAHRYSVPVDRGQFELAAILCGYWAADHAPVHSED